MEDIEVTSSDKLNTSHHHQINWHMILYFMFTLVIGFLGGTLAVRQYDKNLNSNTLNSESRQQIVLKESEIIADIAKNVGPSVVSINVESNARSNFFNQLYSQNSAGTGIIIDKNGLVLTNKHVIPESVTSVQVVLSDGTTYDNVEIVDRDPLNDIAFLRIKDAKNLTPATLGDSDNIRVGDKVVAIGNALGQFDNTVTAGIISGIGRPIVANEGNGLESLQDLLQTDAAINPGNSGGPLVNINGEVVGINTAVAGGAENIGFAIPINDVKSVLDSVKTSGKIVRPYLGVRYVMLSKSIAEELNIKQAEGAYIVKDGIQPGLIADSPADKAGLKEGDIITKIGDDVLTSKDSLVSIIGKFRVGDKIKLSIVRDGNEQVIDVLLEAAPSSL